MDFLKKYFNLNLSMKNAMLFLERVSSFLEWDNLL